MVEALLQSLFAEEPWVTTASLFETTDARGEDRHQRFLRGRRCVATALERAGGPADATIGVGASSEPIWPSGWVGSLSHAGALSIAAVAPSSHARALGVDVEPNGDETTAFTRRVCSDAELAGIQRLGARPEALARVVFSAKEAVYKAQFTESGETIGLHRVEILLEPTRFVARFREAVPGFAAGAELLGRWMRDAAWIMTAVCLPQPARDDEANQKNYGRPP